MPTYRWVVKPPDMPPEIRMVETNDILTAIQGLVGGYIEEYRLTPDVIVLLDEDGIAKSLPQNCGFLGQFVFVQVVQDEEGEWDWGSLTEENARKAVAWCERHAQDVHYDGGIRLITGDEAIAEYRAGLRDMRQSQQAEWDML